MTVVIKARLIIKLMNKFRQWRRLGWAKTGGN